MNDPDAGEGADFSASPLAFSKCTCGSPKCPDAPKDPVEEPEPQHGRPDSPLLLWLRESVRDVNRKRADERWF